MSTSERRASVRTGLGVLVGVIAVAAVAVWITDGDRRAIMRLTPGDRDALYARTLDNLRWCEAHADEMPDFCEREARFVVSFPQCDEECRRLASVWRGPRR